MMGFFNPFGSLNNGGGTPPTPQPESKIKYNTTQYWNNIGDQITEPGVLYIYSDAKDWNGNKVPRLKIGNGILSIGEMPFTDEYQEQQGEPIYVDINEEYGQIVDPGIQDIFYNPAEEAIFFSKRITPVFVPDTEEIVLNF